MNSKTQAFLKDKFNISDNLLKVAVSCEKDLHEAYASIDSVSEYNQLKILKAMQNEGLSESHFGGTTGYGYNDRGREVLEAIYSEVFECEDSLVRSQIVSGTHAVALCLYGVLRPGDELLSVTGSPYDTLAEVIGLRGRGNGSLKELGVGYRQVELLSDGSIDYEGIKEAVNANTRMVIVQKSRGYSWRNALKVDDIAGIVKCVKSKNQDTVVMVDNCYGEFVEESEPTGVGADLAAGSLIKNPGGGLCRTGGYVAGKEKYVSMAACRLTAPGIGKEGGATLGLTGQFCQGLFLAPRVVAESLKAAVFCARIMSRLGFEVSPKPEEKRGDVVQAVRFESEEQLVAFCQGIQMGAPVDSFVVPQPWEMPGYENKVIMAAGTFVQGSSIEQSCDAPIKHPFTAYVQGGLTLEYARTGIIVAAQNLINKGLLTI